tara:strand:+ start:4345 stop:4509 length:165 start_codon:yes stop_codon:yes gene_type:complete
MDNKNNKPATHNKDNKKAWDEYNKVLRELVYMPILDSRGNFIEIAFPIKPSSRK